MELEAKWKDFGRKCGHARARSQHVRAPTRNAGDRMKTLLAGVLLALPVAATATEVTDNFESMGMAEQRRRSRDHRAGRRQSGRVARQRCELFFGPPESDDGAAAGLAAAR